MALFPPHLSVVKSQSQQNARVQDYQIWGEALCVSSHPTLFIEKFPTAPQTRSARRPRKAASLPDEAEALSPETSISCSPGKNHFYADFDARLQL